MDGWLVVLVGLAAWVSLPACRRSPSSRELQQSLDEARHEDDELRKHATSSETAGWSLSVRGNVTGGAVELTWPKLMSLATTHLHTTSPAHTSNVNEVLDYRGIPIAALLDASGAHETDGPGGKELTLVAADGFVASRPLAEARLFPVMLAMEENGEALTRVKGGPLLEVFPHTSHPLSRALYAEGGTYYVTTMFVGTEPLALKVSARGSLSHEVHEGDLAPFEEHVVFGRVGFRFRWPSTPVKIQGVLLRDLVKGVTGRSLRGDDRVLVRRHPRTDTVEREITTLHGDDLLRCDIILGLRSGEDRALLPARLGGPAVVAFPPTCTDAARGQAWPTYVESIEVALAADDAGAARGGSER